MRKNDAFVAKIANMHLKKCCGHFCPRRKAVNFSHTALHNDADGDDDDDGDCGGGGRREGWVTVMLMQFVPLPPTVHQEYTNVRVKMTNRMKYLMAGWN